MINYLINLIGLSVLVSGGVALAGVIILLAANYTSRNVWKLWGELRNIYILRNMEYWFKRMDKEGTHCLRKDFENKLENKDV